MEITFIIMVFNATFNNIAYIVCTVPNTLINYANISVLDTVMRLILYEEK
jgi:hypothetical protein